MYQERDVVDTQKDSNSAIPKLPVLAPQKSLCGQAMDILNDEREMQIESEATGTVGKILLINRKRLSQAVTFD